MARINFAREWTSSDPLADDPWVVAARLTSGTGYPEFATPDNPWMMEKTDGRWEEMEVQPDQTTDRMDE